MRKTASPLPPGERGRGEGALRTQPALEGLNRGPSRSKGFTLIEIVITIVLVGIVAGIAAMIIMQGAQSYSIEQSRGEAHQQARYAAERISREARLIRSCGDINAPANPSATLSFTDITGSAVSFTVAAGTLSRGADTLATGVTSATPFRFLDRLGNPSVTCADPNPDLNIWFVEIDVTSTQGGESLQMRTTVHPRNF